MPLRTLLWFLIPILAAFGQNVGEVADLSVEELLNLQVTSVSKKAQRLAKAPAAVFVITQEDLRRSGATSIAEALRMVPGMQVARLGAAWSISARGGNSRFSNKMLVMVDGRSVYNNFFGGVFWEFLDVLLEDIDRIEVIRGPGAVMWGSNAVNGVINIITRSSKQTVGNLVTASLGDTDNAIVGIRHGGRFSNGAYRVWGKFGDKDVFSRTSRIYEQKFGNNGKGSTADIGFLPEQRGKILRSGFRVDWDHKERDQFTLQGDLFGGLWDNVMSAFQFTPPFAYLNISEDTPAGGNLEGRWVHSHTNGSETAVQFYYDHAQSKLPFNYRSDVLELDVQHTRSLNESNELMLGFNFRGSRTALTPNLQVQTARPVRDDPLFSVVLRDDLQLTPNRLYLSLGVRLEHNNYTGFEYQPSIRFLYTPGKRHSLWGAWSRALRTPSRADQDITFSGFAGFSNNLPVVFGAVGMSNFRSEKLYAHEGGYRYQPGPKWNFDASLFYNRYTDLRTYLPGQPSLQRSPLPYFYVPTLATNGRNETNYGGEFVSTWIVHPRLKLMPSYSWLTKRGYVLTSLSTLQRMLITGEAPAYQVRMRSMLDVTKTWQFDTSFYFVSSMPLVGISSHARVDVRLSWRPTRRQEWSAGVFDASGRESLEGNPEGPFLATFVPRSYLVKWVYKF